MGFYLPSAEFNSLLHKELKYLLRSNIALSQQAASGAVTCEDINTNAFTNKTDEEGVKKCLEMQENWYTIRGYERHTSTDIDEYEKDEYLLECIPHTGDRVADLKTASDKCDLNPDCAGFTFDMDNKRSCLQEMLFLKDTDKNVDVYEFLPSEED